MPPNASPRDSSRQSFTGRLCLIFCLLLTALPSIAQAADPPQYEIKLATLAPENSSLMQIFNEMNAELLKETGGKVGFKIYSGFVLGDEEDVLRKLRIGLVNGAVFTMAALTDISHDLRVLQIPFLFHNYDEVDTAMGAVDADLKRGFTAQGMEVLGWPELGFIYFFSTTPIASVEDLKGKKVWSKSNAPMSQAIIEKAEVSSVPISAPDVLVALQTHLVDVVYNSPYYAVVTQWYAHVKYITDLPLTYMGGALVVERKAIAKIPAPLQETLRKVCATYIKRLNEKTRQDNAEAMEVILKRGVKKVTPTPAQVEGFKTLSEQALATLGPDFIPKETLKKAEAAVADYRAKAK